MFCSGKYVGFQDVIETITTPPQGGDAADLPTNLGAFMDGGKPIFFMFTAASLATVGYQSDPKIWWFGYLNEFMLFYYLWTLYQMLLMLTHYTKAFAMRSFSWGLQNPILDEALWLGFHEADPINCEPSCSWGLGFGACASTSQKGVQENNQNDIWIAVENADMLAPKLWKRHRI